MAPVVLCDSKEEACFPAEPHGWRTGHPPCPGTYLQLQTPDLPPLIFSEAQTRPLVAARGSSVGTGTKLFHGTQGACSEFLGGGGQERTYARRFLRQRRRRWPWGCGGCAFGGPPPVAGLVAVSFSGRGAGKRGLKTCSLRWGLRRILGVPTGLRAEEGL